MTDVRKTGRRKTGRRKAGRPKVPLKLRAQRFGISLPPDVVQQLDRDPRKKSAIVTEALRVLFVVQGYQDQRSQPDSLGSPPSADLVKAALELYDQIQPCEACNGHGQFDRDELPECRQCQGKGISPKHPALIARLPGVNV